MINDTGKIGNINGKWAFLFKATLAVVAALLPFGIALNVWFVTQIHELQMTQNNITASLTDMIEDFVALGPRYTALDAGRDHLEMKLEMISLIQNVQPPRWLKETVERHDEQIDRIERKIDGIAQDVD